LKLAVFTLESLPNAAAVRRFVADHAADIAFVGLSNPYRKSTGGSLGQFLRHLRRSGWRFVPYLAINFSLPEILAALRGIWPGRTIPERTPLKQICKESHIPCATIDVLNGPETRKALEATGAELIVSFHFDQIFTQETLDVAPRGGINVHPSMLPRHRGPIPTFYALVEDPPLFGVTIHRLVEQIDAGAILAQRRVDLPAGISATGAAIALHEAGRILLEGELDKIEKGQETAFPADCLPYCPFPSPLALRQAARQGHVLVRLTDLWAAIRTAF
jgi:folate-dependent phosphoribosylglycinamide formyltransferase PurN